MKAWVVTRETCVTDAEKCPNSAIFKINASKEKKLTRVIFCLGS